MLPATGVASFLPGAWENAGGDARATHQGPTRAGRPRHTHGQRGRGRPRHTPKANAGGTPAPHPTSLEGWPSQFAGGPLRPAQTIQGEENHANKTSDGNSGFKLLCSFCPDRNHEHRQHGDEPVHGHGRQRTGCGHGQHDHISLGSGRYASLRYGRQHGSGHDGSAQHSIEQRPRKLDGHDESLPQHDGKHNWH